VSPGEVTKNGLRCIRPGRDATIETSPERPGGSSSSGGRGGAGRADQAMVPDASFTSYYGQPIINRPVWEAPDIAGYLFLGGLAGASSLVALGAQITGRSQLETTVKVGATTAISLSLVALVHDLGRPGRFLNMLRTFKVTSPMSVGTWLLAGYAPATGVATACKLTGLLPSLGASATAAAALMGPAVATYTAALVSNTAVPAWHQPHREMPFAFAASAMSSAAGLALIGAPLPQTGPVRRLGVLASILELVGMEVIKNRSGLAKECYEKGKAKQYARASKALVSAGTLGALAGRRNRPVTVASGVAMLAGAACERFAIFEAGLASADDPKYTVVPQRARLGARVPAAT